MLKERDIEIDLTSPPRNDSSNNQIKEVESFRETDSRKKSSRRTRARSRERSNASTCFDDLDNSTFNCEFRCGRS